MPRRLLLLLLLLVLPAPLRAQTFRSFTSPGGDLWFMEDIYSTGYAHLPLGEELFLLDATGARVKQLGATGTGADFWDLFIGTFAPGEQFGFEWASLQSGLSDFEPDVLGGPLHLRSVVDTGTGHAMLEYSLYYPHGTITPEPMSMALLATGLVGLGVVAWRKRQGAV